MHPIAKAYMQCRLAGKAPGMAARQAVYTEDYACWTHLVANVMSATTQEAYLQRFLDEVHKYLPEGEL